MKIYAAEELTPCAADAVDGMLGAFTSELRSVLGPGTNLICAAAWTQWRRSLLANRGIDAAESAAYLAAANELNKRVRYAYFLWLSEERLSRAIQRAAQVAANSA